MEADSSYLEGTDEEGNNMLDFDKYSGSLIGMERETICLMYDLYRKHARSMGSSVRKSTRILSKDGNNVLTSKLFVCSCTGVNRTRNELQITIYKRKRCTRTDCKAQMRVKLTTDGQYEVVKHIQEHNQPLTRRECNHLHRSERAIKEGKAIAITEMTSSGLIPSDSYRYLALSAGGEDQIGHTMKDHLNFVHRSKMKNMEGGDAKTFMNLIQDQEDEENQFFYRVQMNDEGRMNNIFWRDSMMKEDFDLFGDVMVFDTTYRTNRYNLVSAPFVGINHHWKNTMFDCAFLSDEKIESFK